VCLCAFEDEVVLKAHIVFCQQQNSVEKSSFMTLINESFFVLRVVLQQHLVESFCE